MKKKYHIRSLLIPAILALFLLNSCKKENLEELVPSNHILFQKYYGIAEDAIKIIASPGGFTILANGIDHNNIGYIVLIRLDQNGSIVWQKEIKEQLLSTAGNDLSHTADGGYLVAGEKYDAWGQHGAQLIRLDTKGETLWTTLKNESDSIPILEKIYDENWNYIRTDTTGWEQIANNSVGMGAVELPGENVAFLMTKTKRNQPDKLYLQILKGNGDSLNEVEHYYLDQEDARNTATGLVWSEAANSLFILGESDIFDQGSSDQWVTKANANGEWDYDDLFWRFAIPNAQGEETDNFDASSSIVFGNDGIFFIGTTVSHSDGKERIFASKVNFELELIWEFLDEAKNGSKGLGIASLPNGGAALVGVNYDGRNEDMVAIEVGAIPFKEIKDGWSPEEKKRLTFGSKVEPEMASSIFVTEEGHWMVFGSSEYRGDKGLTLTKIDPERIP